MVRPVPPVPPERGRSVRTARRAAQVEAMGRFSSPLVLLGSAVVSMVLLSLASIVMLRDLGRGSEPRLQGRMAVPAAVDRQGELTGGQAPAEAGEVPEIAGSEGR